MLLELIIAVAGVIKGFAGAMQDEVEHNVRVKQYTISFTTMAVTRRKPRSSDSTLRFRPSTSMPRSRSTNDKVSISAFYKRFAQATIDTHETRDQLVE